MWPAAWLGLSTRDVRYYDDLLREKKYDTVVYTIFNFRKSYPPKKKETPRINLRVDMI